MRYWATVDPINWTFDEVSVDAPEEVARCVGHNMWEAFPGAEAAFRPTYELAFVNGSSAKLVYWNGVVTDIAAFRQGRRLLVRVETLTVTGLLDVLETISGKLAAEGQPLEPEPPTPARPTLRLA